MPTGILDLPTPIFVDILLHVSPDKILICKCVCKAWHKIIFDPQFTKLYSATNNYKSGKDVHLLIRPASRLHVYRTLYSINPRYHHSSDSSKMKLETKFKIPVCNYEKALKFQSSTILTQEQGGGKRKRYLELKSYDNKFDIVNSCNGFLCLSNKDIAIVSNPVTDEYIEISPPIVSGNAKNIYGLGFSPRNAEYKVIRIFGNIYGNWIRNYGPTTGYSSWYSSYAQIQIMGTRTWRNVTNLAPYYLYLKFPTYLNGNLNWIVRSYFVVFFNFDNECFGSFSTPLGCTDLHNSLGLLRDHLCYSSVEKDVLCIWEMKEYGDEVSWTKVCNLELSGNLDVRSCIIFRPIVRLEDGTILLFHGLSKKEFGITYYEPTKRRQKYFRIRGIAKVDFEAVYYTPSYVLLKDVLVGDEVEVLNVKSRCGKLNIRGESRNPILVHCK